MATGTEKVHEFLDEDLVAQEALARGIVKRSTLCQWLKQEHELDITLDTIDKAIRDYDPGEPTGLLRDARESFSHVQFRGNSPIALFKVKRRAETYRALGEVFQDVDNLEDDKVAVLPSKGYFLVLVDRDHRDEVLQTLRPSNVVGVDDDLRTLVVEGRESEKPGAGILNLAVSALLSAGIEVEHMATGPTEDVLFLHEDDIGDALGLLHDLKRGMLQSDEPGSSP